ncbi:MAG TPA: TonB-dependent receptor [Azospirillaceae bacterium]|nr:TonB-dependent receptor [Azospirillaceae bacterium]HRQ80781.1 TonB-dependent receptor [Azospirillaceae bacterium]
MRSTYRAAVLSTVLFLPTLGLAPSKAFSADDPVKLPTLSVTGAKPASLGSGTLEQARDELKKVPGGTAVVDGETVKEGAVRGAADLFGFVPGLVVQEASSLVNGATRLMMRGSAINSGASPIRGVKVLQDGIPLTMASGLTDTEAVNPWWAERVEVYKGANALQWGASNLGGAINIVTPTGYSAPGLRARGEAGSYGYRKLNIGAGQAFANGFDAYVAVTSMYSEGFRDRTTQSARAVLANLGYRWNSNHETRLFVDLQDNDYNSASNLTQAEIKAGSKINTRPVNSPTIGYPVKRFAIKHTAMLDGDDRLDVGAYYHEKNFNFASAGVRDWHDDWKDAGVNFRHQAHGKLGGMANRFLWGALYQVKWVRDWEYPMNAAGQRGRQDFEESDRYKNLEIFFEDQIDLTQSLTLSVGAQWGYRYAKSDRFLPLPAAAPIVGTHGEASWSQLNPKVGLIWTPVETHQLFANISRSWEPPRRGDLINFYNSPQLTDQSAITYEVGGRGKLGPVSYDLSLYHARVDDEILVIENPPGSRTYFMSNVPKSIHQGIEFGAETTLKLNALAADDSVRLRGVYTFSDFRFDGDQTFGDNRMAGVPQHIGRLEATYRHPSSLMLGVGAQFVSDMWADFANTKKADGYVLLNAMASYDVTEKLRVFVEGRNLTDEKYVAFVSPQANVRGADSRIYSPGAPASVFVGFDLKY